MTKDEAREILDLVRAGVGSDIPRDEIAKALIKTGDSTPFRRAQAEELAQLALAA